MKPSWFFVLFSISILLFPAGTAAIEDPMHRTMGDDDACDLVIAGHESVVADEPASYQDLVAKEADPGTASKRGVPTPGPTTPAVLSSTVRFQGDLGSCMVRSGGVSLWIVVRNILDDPEDFLDFGDYVQVDYYFTDSEPEYQIHYVIDQDIESGDAVEVFCSASRESNWYASTENYRLGADHYVRRIENPQFTPPVLALEVTRVDNLSVTIDPALEPDDWTKKTLRMHWDWGDGKTDDRLLAMASYVCEGECPDWDGLFPPVDPVKHTYAEPGTYTIKATVYLSGNQKAEASVTVTVGSRAAHPAGMGDGSTNTDLIDRYSTRDPAYSDLLGRYRNRDSTYSDLIDQYRNRETAPDPIEPDEGPDRSYAILTDGANDYESAYSNLVERYQNRDSVYSVLIGRYRNL